MSTLSRLLRSFVFCRIFAAAYALGVLRVLKFLLSLLRHSLLAWGCFAARVVVACGLLSPGVTLRGVVLRGVVLLLVVGLAGCSAEKDTFMARNYHNVLAHYNGFFLGREKVRETEETILKGQKDNYNKPLPVFAPAGAGKGSDALLDEAIKKASIPIQRHKNSDWVDDSYLVIGKARYYKDDYENAIQTFKFVNSKGKDPNAKHEALIWLLRTYTDMKEYIFAGNAIDAIKKKTLNKRNSREFALASAHIAYRQKEWDAVLKNVEKALPLMRKRERRGRMEFLAGQMQQKAGKDPDAYAHFRMVLRCNPSYELGFNAKLGMAQATNPGDEKGIKKIQKYFRKLLKDDKNLEYKDKIYYEMAHFELKLKHTDKAIEFHNSSLRANGKSQGVKGYNYLDLGVIYYERLRKFNVAKLYYDSAVAALDTAEENYKAVVRRQKILAEFVKEYDIIEREDSLQRLARMDSTMLFAKLDGMAATTKKAADVADKLAEKEARKAARLDALTGGTPGEDPFAALGGGQPPGGPGAPGGPGGLGGPDAGLGSNGLWYFYNPSLVAKGKATFSRKWGRRKLEDNWRRARKEADPNSEEGQAEANKPAGGDSTLAKADPNKPNGAGGKAGAGGKSDGKDGKGGEGGEDKAKAEYDPKAARASLLKDVPLTPDAMKASDEKLRLALFNIGKIYDQKLEEHANGVVSFQRVGRQFGDWDKVPEGLYNLYLIYGRANARENTQDMRRADSVKRELTSRYPNTVFAKLANNPNWLVENRAATEEAKKVYKQAYESYQSNRYIEAGRLIASIRREYPENTFSDRVDLLATMIVGKTVDATTYKDSLTHYLTRYPKSDLVPTAKRMMEIATKYGAKGQGPDTGAAKVLAPPGPMGMPQQPPVAWSTTGLDGEHHYIALVPLDRLTEDEASRKFSDFNTLLFSEDNLTVSTLLFGPTRMLISVKMLRSRAVANYYLQKQKSLEGALEDLADAAPEMYIITPENYRLLYQTKNQDSYKVWFKKNYLK